jgi:uncharacterized protein (DUF58 family)
MAEAALPETRLGIRAEAERAAGRLPPLLVRAFRVAATVMQGVHGRRRSGSGEAFWQFRRYEPGDSVRQIDWRQSGKSDRLFVRETEWAAAQSLYLWCDVSPSMRWRSHKRFEQKRERAELLTLALAQLVVRGGERVALLGTGDRPIMGRAAVDKITLHLLGPGHERGAAVAASETGLPPFEALPRHAVLVLIGDLLAPLEDIDRVCRLYAARGVNGYLVQVLDRAETTLPYNGRTRFEGLEEEGHLLVKRAENVREDYRQRLAEHQQGLSDLARALGWHWAVHRTDQPPEQALLSLFVHLSEGR